MRPDDNITRRLSQPARLRARLAVLDRGVWRQLPRSIGYVLLAGPLGLTYLFLLGLGLTLDLVLLVLRVLVASVLVLAYTLAQAVLWVLQFGLRFLWVSMIAVLVWMVLTARALLVSAVRTIARIVWIVLVDITHPRTAWQRAVAGMRDEQERTPRVSRGRTISARAAATRLWLRIDRGLDAGVGMLERFKRRVVPEPWFIVPPIWWHLARLEHRLTVVLLKVDLPPLPPSRLRLVPDASGTSASSQMPLASLAYLLAKLPLSALALALIVFTLVVCGWLLEAGNTIAAIAIALGLVYALHALARLSGRFALRAFSPSAATRRLLAAEALAAQEHAKAERADQSRRDLIVNVGHELRTPTANILGHIESLLLALDEPDRRVDQAILRSYLAIVQREAERLGSLVDELLALARAETDELRLSITPVDATTVIDEVHEALAPLARRERRVMLVREVEPDLPLLLADRRRLTQVLLNLVRNAITYTPPGGVVSVTLRRADRQYLLLSVSDTGSGIEPTDLDRIFERFYRADASRARSSGGFGLGLAIVRELVEAMGGSVTASSTLGKGSCFEVKLPTTNRSFIVAHDPG